MLCGAAPDQKSNSFPCSRHQVPAPLRLALQLHSSFQMRASRGSLMRPVPERPGDDACRLDAPLCQAGGNAADFLERLADEAWRACVGRRVVFEEAGRFAWWRTVASMANANMTRETWRCQLCQDRLSLWSRPNSFSAISKLSSMLQRCLSTWTSVSTPVPAGYQAVKNAWAPSARAQTLRVQPQTLRVSATPMLRRFSRPRVHRPMPPRRYSSASRSASSRYARS